MDIFIFTYSEDKPLLPLCISHAAPHGRVVLVDDGNSPATDEAEALGMGAAEYVRSTFDRRGNLNGAPCVRGMLEVYRDHGQDSWLMQVDSNMLLFRPELLQVAEHGEPVALIGQAAGYCDAWLACTPVHYARGGGMMLRRDMVEKMLAKLDAPGIVERIESGKGFSDHVLTVLCQMCGGRVHLWKHESAAMVGGVYKRVGWFTFEEHSHLWLHAAAVHFCPKCAPGETAAERNLSVLEAMQEVADTWAPKPEETSEE